jgi:hypothetical protein
MNSKGRVCAPFAGLALLFFLGSQAVAAPITYVFTVTATSGPLNGSVANGQFSFDSSSITSGADNSSANLLTDLLFTWDGIFYDATAANTGYLTFDPSGVLTSATFGNNCSPGTCLVTNGLENWWISGATFDYSISGNSNAFAGTVTMQQTPEPSTVAMLLTALGLFIVRLRMPRPAR